MKNSKIIKFSIILAIILFVILILSILVFYIPKMYRENKSNTNSNTTNNSQLQKDINNNSQLKSTDIASESKITYINTEDKSRIPVPEGFSYVEGTISSGAVIQDENGNQFVWVPTDDIVFRRKNLTNPNNNQIQNNIDENKSTMLNDFSIFSETAESNRQYIDSVNKYKGFYIARFESSKDPNDENKAKSIRGQKPLTEMVYKKMRRMAQNTYKDHSSVSSDIASSYTWDTMCEWLEKSGYNIYDSTSYGNYYNNSEGEKRVYETGRNEKWCTNNIYDLAGNVWEITTEEWGNVYNKNHCGRGGGSINDGVTYPISCRLAEYDGSYSYIGFRMVLYLK